jgi:hypothetical protein
MLAKKPYSTILTFQGYEINGNTFYTIAQDILYMYRRVYYVVLYEYVYEKTCSK